MSSILYTASYKNNIFLVSAEEQEKLCMDRINDPDNPYNLNILKKFTDSNITHSSSLYER